MPIVLCLVLCCFAPPVVHTGLQRHLQAGVHTSDFGSVFMLSLHCLNSALIVAIFLNTYAWLCPPCLPPLLIHGVARTHFGLCTIYSSLRIFYVVAGITYKRLLTQLESIGAQHYTSMVTLCSIR